jgi:hypothetical protein
VGPFVSIYPPEFFLTLIKSAADLSNRRIDFLNSFPGLALHLHALIFVYNAVLNKLFTSPLVLLECPAFGSLEQKREPFFRILGRVIFEENAKINLLTCPGAYARIDIWSYFKGYSKSVTEVQIAPFCADPKCQI